MPIFLESPRLILKSISLKHCSIAYLSWLRDKNVNKYLEISNHTVSHDSLKKYVKTSIKSNDIFLAIHLKESLKHIGNVKIDKINTIHQTGQFGIMIGDKSEWGKGYAKEATIASLTYVFNTLKLRKISLGVIKDHSGAHELYKKLGFKVEGVLKQHYFYDNKYRDAILMAIFKNKWRHYE